MLEPIPFLGWFNWFEDPEPMTEDQIIQSACNAFGGLIKKAERENFVKFAKSIEEHHGIK